MRNFRHSPGTPAVITTRSILPVPTVLLVSAFLAAGCSNGNRQGQGRSRRRARGQRAGGGPAPAPRSAMVAVHVRHAAHRGPREAEVVAKVGGEFDRSWSRKATR